MCCDEVGQDTGRMPVGVHQGLELWVGDLPPLEALAQEIVDHLAAALALASFRDVAVSLANCQSGRSASRSIQPG